MNLTRVFELADQANEFITTMKENRNGYVDKINSYLNDLEKLNNAGTHSDQYIQSKTKVIQENIADTLKGFEKKNKGYTEQLKIWYDDQMNKIKLNIVTVEQNKLGVDVPEDVLKSLADAIPHPELVIPELKITIPEISAEPNVSVTIPRIPKI